MISPRPTVRLGAAVVLSVLAVACSSARDDELATDRSHAASTSPTSGAPATAEAASATGASTGATPAPTAAATEPATTTTAAPTTTEWVPGTPNPNCLVTIEAGDGLLVLAAEATARLGQDVSVQGIQDENAIPDADHIQVGQVLDVCVGNMIDDTTGDDRPPPTTTTTTTTTLPPPPPIPPALTDYGSGVPAQQQKLNDLLTPYGMAPLSVDGSSGALTRQALCAARVALGLPASRADMVAGSDEERLLMTASGLGLPPGAPTAFSRWVLVDQTCQVLFAGVGNSHLVFVFPTSTGQAGYETRNQGPNAAFRFDPALDNGGWHDSSEFPSGVDNPLNGNMYKPLYFDDGQAIHGANNVPPSPASKGCARLSLPHQDALLAWLGIGDQPLWEPDDIRLAVTVQGAY